MTGLLEQPQTDAPDAPQAAPDAPPPEVAGARACPSCGNALRDEQDWCLECGSAQPGRLGGRHGWRAALAVLGATALLATGAVAAAYAALSSEATRQAAAPPAPSAVPTVAAPPSVPAPAGESEVPTIPAPNTSDDSVAQTPPSPSASPAPSTPNPTPTPAPSGGTGSSGGGSSEPAPDPAPAEPEPLALKAGAASTYDPHGRGNGRVGDPADAIDGKSSTAWQAPVDAEGNVDIGLAISLQKARTLSAVEWRADTPGFTVEVYATRDAQLPRDVLDPSWEHIDDRRDVGVRERVALDGRFKHVLLWVRAQPADSKVAIPEVEVFG